uniref:COesterase domain-containing protein n=1 Tax=Ascaris lumbricoides TaxID=6252 RepID=A0A0M3IBX1_ASCLU
MLYITEMETFAMNYIFLVVALLLNVCCAQQKDSIVATTTLGELIGFRVDYGSDRAQLYYGKADVFLGVPYVKPPIGPLRFAKPVPITQFTSDGKPYNATYQHPICPQLTSSNASMSEDCLIMNIFSPNVKFFYKFVAEILESENR